MLPCVPAGDITEQQETDFPEIPTEAAFSSHLPLNGNTSAFYFFLKNYFSRVKLMLDNDEKNYV